MWGAQREVQLQGVMGTVVVGVGGEEMRGFGVRRTSWSIYFKPGFVPFYRARPECPRFYDLKCFL